MKPFCLEPIVVTGMGVLACNGIGREAFWDALKNGESGIGPIDRFDTENFPCKIGGQRVIASRDGLGGGWALSLLVRGGAEEVLLGLWETRDEAMRWAPAAVFRYLVQRRNELIAEADSAELRAAELDVKDAEPVLQGGGLLALEEVACG